MSVVTGSPVDFFDPPQNGQPSFESRPAIGVDAGAIGLVERRLEHQRRGRFGGDLLQPRGDRKRQFFASRSRTVRR